MKYDVVIIGGGLSALTAGITLASNGKRVCMVAAGQNSLHFSSGSFDFLGYDADGNAVTNPIEAIKTLPTIHPYRIIGEENIGSLVTSAQALLSDAGVETKGEIAQNHYRITPIGTIKPTWLTIEGYATAASLTETRWKKADLINIQGFLDFPIEFLVDNLRDTGTTCTIRNINTEALTQARKSPTEMRATNVAKYLDSKTDLMDFANAINAIDSDAEVVLVPAVLGLNNSAQAEELKALVKKPIEFIATMPPSVLGMRTSTLLKRKFMALGGTILVSDTAVSGVFENNRLVSIATSQLPDEVLRADQFILASGSFLSHGLKSDYEKVYEPVLGVDVEAVANRAEWTKENVYDAQPYMEFGVKTDAQFHALKEGVAIENLYAAGSILCGNNDIKLASKEGVAMLTALQVANIIKEK